MKLKTYLDERAETETAFAQRAGFKQATINRYVRGERFPDAEAIERIAAATDGSVSVLDWHQQELERRAEMAERAA